MSYDLYMHPQLAEVFQAMRQAFPVMFSTLGEQLASCMVVCFWQSYSKQYGLQVL